MHFNHRVILEVKLKKRKTKAVFFLPRFLKSLNSLSNVGKKSFIFISLEIPQHRAGKLQSISIEVS